MSKRNELIGKLDNIFSQFIRNRDCKNGKGVCISCGTNITPQNSDCGHFIARRHIGTRYDERNCNAQCVECNRFRGGNPEGYRLGLIEKYGQGVIQELEQKKNIVSKLTISELNELKTYFQRELNEAKKNQK